jgi:AraC-like DNA-binding protein
MKIYLKFDQTQAFKKLVSDLMKKSGIKYELIGSNEISLQRKLSTDDYNKLSSSFAEYGIEFVENQKNTLVQRIKDAIIEMVYSEDGPPSSKVSIYLAEKLGHSYGYLANVFSEVTFSSIENFIILQKIERVKELLMIDQLTLTEISFKLHYSSVAHLSGQFKKTTGLTPSAFQKIIRLRRSMSEKQV